MSKVTKASKRSALWEGPIHCGETQEEDETQEDSEEEADDTQTGAYFEDASEDDEEGATDASLSDDSMLTLALPITEIDVEEEEEGMEPALVEEEDGEAYLRSVRREARQMGDASTVHYPTSTVHHPTWTVHHPTRRATADCPDGAQLSLSNPECLQQIEPRPSSSVSHPRLSAVRIRRCDYLEKLLHLDQRAADRKVVNAGRETAVRRSNGPVVARDTVEHRPDAAFSTDDAEDEAWRQAALKAFEEFRQFLGVLSTAAPELSGEVGVTPKQRDWEDEEWEEFILSHEPSMEDVGVLDNVRAVAILESVATYLKHSNKELASKENTILHRTPELSDAIKPSKLVFRRVLRWAFAGLANLDLLQSIDADVAHNLQIMRRCCRWLKGVLSDPDLEGDVCLVELIIQDWFRQR